MSQEVDPTPLRNHNAILHWRGEDGPRLFRNPMLVELWRQRFAGGSSFVDWNVHFSFDKSRGTPALVSIVNVLLLAT